MFQSSAIMRLHHLFVIQTLLELHKQCNLWYSRLKHKFVFLLNNRLRLNSLRSITSRRLQLQQQSANNNRDYCKPAGYHYYRGYGNGDIFDSSYQEYTGTQQQHQQQQQANDFGCGQFMSDLSRALLNVGGAALGGTTTTTTTTTGQQQNTSGSLAIPMHMLLLPLVVHQPRVVSPHDPIGGGLQASAVAISSSSYNGLKQGHEIYRASSSSSSSSSNNLRHLANNGAQMCSFALGARPDEGGLVCGGRTTPAQLYQTAHEQHTARVRGPVSNCNLAGATKSTWASSSSRSNNLYATTRSAAGSSSSSSSLALRNPLICFPSTSNEIGHVKYM